ncbi:MAG: aminopeptidase N [Betaproteobacteria bacterium CG2_30_68_42]|nr:MAG: aminopeptidase N [Betaproteobacteria bacterium CG2_30_68_42]PIX76037.1 MAG: aminopeptidase N [Rhodocyclales bacterium CG_4_10_14_3_um_filter_68_10]
MREAGPRTIRLKDYTPPAFLIDEVDLDFDLCDERTRVRAKLALRRNPAAAAPDAPLALDAEDIELVSVRLDGRTLAPDAFSMSAAGLVVAQVPDAFTLETECLIDPEHNTRLEGLYASSTGYFTQCEAQGFRRITCFLDRPDVMSRYTTTIHAARSRFPVLLSNGNRVAEGEEPEGRHWVRWRDPFPKPCYLFALVAARLDALEDEFVTRSRRRVRLALYVEPGKLASVAFAMQALKRAMKWDEERFGLELDLDQYMVVAVGDFNSGAMENKGLNIFNTKYLLAAPETATDSDFFNVDRVIAHEYFHNWTGDRVTCRDWFQLSLKEGLTVYRDQEYGADTFSRSLVRIQEVRNLRTAQFAEDAGPMAHPVRPDAYVEIRNFYTTTVYEKGAEVVRMIATLAGREGFRKGMDLYFARHDGQAVTCEDFVRAMADANGIDLTQFLRWYEQAGTPVLEVEDAWDEAAGRYALTVRQSCPPTPGQPAKEPFHIPFALGLLGPAGEEIPLRLEGEPAGAAATTRVLSVTERSQCFVFPGVTTRPVPSLARGFSAPVIVKYPYTDEQLAHLGAHDTDAFSRWEALQRLALDAILRGIEALRAGRAVEVPQALARACARVLEDARSDPAFCSEALNLPAEAYVAEQLEVVDPEAIHAARQRIRVGLAHRLEDRLTETRRNCAVPGPYRFDAVSAGLRAARNLCLAYLIELDTPEYRALAWEQFERADNMTNRMAALSALANCDCPEREKALAAFYERWKGEPLVVDKWLAVQAASRLPDTLDRVRALTAHPAFDIRNPNKVYALIRTFGANQVRFHAADGSGYAFMADRVIVLDALNPQVAARMTRAFDRWRRFDPGRQAHARAALERIGARAGLSADVAEVVSRSLAPDESGKDKWGRTPYRS